MSAYKVEMSRRVCRWCSRPAVFEVFNCKSASAGFFCKAHGDTEVRKLDTVEEHYNLLHPREGCA